MWNPKNNINEQNRNRLTDTETGGGQMGGAGDWGKGEGTEKYKWAIRKQSGDVKHSLGNTVSNGGQVGVGNPGGPPGQCVTV